MSYLKGVRLGSEGNKTLLKTYGGHAADQKRQGYATGGTVAGANRDGPAMAEGMEASGSPAKPSLARPGRKIGKKKDGKKGTSVNVIIMSGKDDAVMPPPPMVGPPPGPPPGPPMPPPGAGGPPMPMRASGGRVAADCKEAVHKHEKNQHKGQGLTKLKMGGKVKKRADGGPTPGERMQAARQRRDEAAGERNSRATSALLSAGARAAMGAAPGPMGRIGRALKGANTLFAGTSALGAATSEGKRQAAEREMRELGQGRAVEGEEDRKAGGPVMGLKNKDGGAGGGLGRLAKIKKYGK